MNSSESDSDCSAQNDLIRRYSELLGVDDDYEEDHDSGEDDELAGMARAMSDRLCGDKATCGAPPCPLTFHRLPGGSGRYYALRDNFSCSSDIFAMARSLPASAVGPCMHTIIRCIHVCTRSCSVVFEAMPLSCVQGECVGDSGRFYGPLVLWQPRFYGRFVYGAKNVKLMSAEHFGGGCELKIGGGVFEHNTSKLLATKAPPTKVSIRRIPLHTGPCRRIVVVCVAHCSFHTIACH